MHREVTDKEDENVADKEMMLKIVKICEDVGDDKTVSKLERQQLLLIKDVVYSKSIRNVQLTRFFLSGLSK